jgi:two-component system sensor histidine kinase QseC
MMSLRWRLFLILLLATGAVWLSAAAWIHQRTNREVERVLDSRLQEAARMVHSLVSDDGLAGSRSDGKGPSPVLPLPSTGYERQLSCQIWSIAGRLVGRSSGAPEAALTEQANGFSERVVAGEKWRVYAIEDPVKGVRILVGDRLDLRDRLIADLIAGLLAPALLIVPLLGGLTWLSVGRGLQPLSALAGRLRSRGAADMSAISLENAPPEVAPLIDALNDLLVRLEQARNHERDVTAFAAHELRTPLAGLKAQAQIAMMAADAETKDKALRQIVHSVDRASRLVRQLLALARIEAGYQAAEPETIDLEALIADIAAACSQPNAPATRLHPSLRGRSVRCDRELLTAALRNLQENAVC